jgi:hypothetical protein
VIPERKSQILALLVRRGTGNGLKKKGHQNSSDVIKQRRIQRRSMRQALMLYADNQLDNAMSDTCAHLLLKLAIVPGLWHVSSIQKRGKKSHLIIEIGSNVKQTFSEAISTLCAAKSSSVS